jgi:transposase InsO family protein
MRGDAHVRFGGRAEETSQRERQHRAPARPYTEHPTREGKIYCCAVIDAFSRMVVGWAIDSRQTGLLVTNALGMALNQQSEHPDSNRWGA